MQKKKIRCAFLFCCLFCLLLSIGVTAEEPAVDHALSEVPFALEDGGFYHVRSALTGGILGVSQDIAEEGDGAVLCYMTADDVSTVFYVTKDTDGNYLLAPVSYGGNYVLGYENDRPDGLCLRSSSDTLGNAFRVTEAEGGCRIHPAQAAENSLHLVLAPDENGTPVPAFSPSADRESVWEFRPYTPSGFRISATELRTSVYTAYDALRALTDLTEYAPFIEWSSSDRSVAIVDKDGKFCTLGEGDAVLYARLGTKTLSCRLSVHEGQQYTWYSQKNMTDGGWNGDAVYDIYFYAGGVKRRFAIDKQVHSTDWLSEGCALCSISMVLNNMGARYTDGYDFRSGMDGNIIADPYTVALANTANKGAKTPKETLYGDPVLTNHRGIASRFQVDGKTVTVTLTGNVTKQKIKEALDENPWGVVVRFDNSYCGTHYITFNRCLNPDAQNPNDYIFTISDPASHDRAKADDVIFEQSFSYINLHYRFYHADLMQIWSYEK